MPGHLRPSRYETNCETSVSTFSPPMSLTLGSGSSTVSIRIGLRAG
jgi:hypothetical protein